MRVKCNREALLRAHRLYGDLLQNHSTRTANFVVNVFINSCHYLKLLFARPPLPSQEYKSGCEASPKILSNSPSSCTRRRERRDAAVQKLHMWLQNLVEVCVGTDSSRFFPFCAFRRKHCRVSGCCSRRLINSSGALTTLSFTYRVHRHITYP